MTVKELKEKLEEYPDDFYVHMETPTGEADIHSVRAVETGAAGYVILQEDLFGEKT